MNVIVITKIPIKFYSYSILFLVNFIPIQFYSYLFLFLFSLYSYIVLFQYDAKMLQYHFHDQNINITS